MTQPLLSKRELNTVFVGLKINKTTEARLKQLERHYNISRSELVRVLLSAGMARVENHSQLGTT